MYLYVYTHISMCYYCVHINTHGIQDDHPFLGFARERFLGPRSPPRQPHEAIVISSVIDYYPYCSIDMIIMIAVSIISISYTLPISI